MEVEESDEVCYRSAVQEQSIRPPGMQRSGESFAWHLYHVKYVNVLRNRLECDHRLEARTGNYKYSEIISLYDFISLYNHRTYLNG